LGPLRLKPPPDWFLSGFAPSAYVIPPPVAFPGIQVNPGFAFSAGVSVPGPFLQPGVHAQAGTPVQAGKQSHIPYSQQRPSGPGSSAQGPGPMNQVPSQAQQQPSQQALQQSVQLQVHSMSQQQSPTKPVQQGGMGKSPPHHPGLQQVGSRDHMLVSEVCSVCHALCFCSEQYMQVQDQPAQMWTQAQAALQKLPPMQMSMKQQQTFYMAAQDPLKLYEHQLQPPNMDKKMKYPDFHWEPPYRMGDGLAMMAERMKRPPPGGLCAEQEGPGGPRGPPFEVSSEGNPLLSASGSLLLLLLFLFIFLL